MFTRVENKPKPSTEFCDATSLLSRRSSAVGQKIFVTLTVSRAWESRSADLSDTSFTQALEELRCARKILEGRSKFPTMRCLFIEKDPARFAQLKSFCNKVKDIPVRPENWDFRQHVSEVVAFTKEKQKSFPFIFIDPTGWEPIAIDTIRPILQLKPGEVLINLMTSWIRRFLTDESKNFERLLGGATGRLRQLQGDEQEDELVRVYSDAIRAAGNFDYVCNLPVLMPDRDALHFSMVYATRNPKGVEEFKRAEKVTTEFMHTARHEAQTRKKVKAEGYFLPGLEPSYQETRYSRLREANLEIAQHRLEQRLKQEETVHYDDAWADTMQYASVEENDFKDWIRKWHSIGVLGFEGLEPSARFPRRNMGHVLKWLSK